MTPLLAVTTNPLRALPTWPMFDEYCVNENKKAVVDYLTSEANAPTLTAMSSQYEMAASQCYQFVNTFPYYDVMDYLNKLRDNVFRAGASGCVSIRCLMATHQRATTATMPSGSSILNCN